MGKAKDYLTDVATGVLEPFFDAVMKEGVLRDLPALSTFVGLARATNTVRDNLFLAKLKAFWDNFEDIPEADKHKMRSRLEKEQERERIGEKLVFSLERADELEKARVLGKCFEKYLEGVISKDELFRFWHAVDKCFIGDLKELQKYRTAYKSRHEYSGGSLLGAGLIESADVGGPRATAFDANEIEYILTPLGRRFYELFFQKRKKRTQSLEKFMVIKSNV